MKTAMQELIDELKRVQSMTNMNFVIKVATDLLEKEKEQIENAYWDGGQDVPTNGDRCQEYYNQNYNK